MNKTLWITCLTSIIVTTVKFTSTTSLQQQAHSIDNNQQSSDTNRWSKPATATRRQGDWVPLTVPCPSCHNVLPAVLRPPDQLHEEPRFLAPPPLPADSLLHQEASGSIVQSFSQPLPQATNKQPRQLQEQQPNLHFKHQAEQQQYIQQNNQQLLKHQINQQPQAFQINPLYNQNAVQLATQQQYISNPQFITPFIQHQQQRVIPQFVPQISSINIQHQQHEQQQQQQQQHLQGNNAIKSTDLPVLPNPVFIPQQVPTIPHVPPVSQQDLNQYTLQTPQQQEAHEVSETYQEHLIDPMPNISNSNSNEEKGEVQLLYVPVETLRNRGRNLSRLKQTKQSTEPNVQQSFTNTAYLQENSKSTYNQNIQEPSFIQKEEPETEYQKTQNNRYQQQNYQEQFSSEKPAYQQQQEQHTSGEQIFSNQQVISSQFLQQQQPTQKPSDVYTTTPVTSRKHRFQKSRQQQQQQQQQQKLADQYDISSQFLPEITRTGQQQHLYNQQLMSEQPRTNVLQTQSNPLPFKQATSMLTQKNTEQLLNQKPNPPPHQPPLSVYMDTGENHDTPETLILNLLKNAKTIPVLDAIGPESPQVFVGPSNLNPPNGYLKFELPYLSSLDSNRVERKVDGLPFFVAPLNFNPPPGYSKIPFPAPHIGSVVVSNATVLKTALHGKDHTTLSTTLPGQIYSNPYILTPGIASISPQLPSLVNSLQDELFSLPPSTTTTTTTSTTTTTPEPVVTTSFRRTHQRGSVRGHSAYTTTTYSPTRRSSSRRRPYSNRQYSSYRQTVRTTTTTTQPTTSEQYDQQESVPETYDDSLVNLQRSATPSSIIHTQEVNTQQYNDNTHQTTNKFISQQKFPLSKGQFLSAGLQNADSLDASYEYSGKNVEQLDANKNQQSYQFKEYSSHLGNKQFDNGKFINSEDPNSQVPTALQNPQNLPLYEEKQTGTFKNNRESSLLKQTFLPLTNDETVFTLSSNHKTQHNNGNESPIVSTGNDNFKHSDDSYKNIYSHEVAQPSPLSNDNNQQHQESAQFEFQNQKENFQQFKYNDKPLQQTQIVSIQENIPHHNLDSIYNVNIHNKRVPVIKYDDVPEQKTMPENKRHEPAFEIQEEITAQTSLSESQRPTYGPTSAPDIPQTNRFQAVQDESIYNVNQAQGNIQLEYSKTSQHQDPPSITEGNPTGHSFQQDLNGNTFQTTVPPRLKYTETTEIKSLVTDDVLTPSSRPPNYHGIRDESIFNRGHNQRSKYIETQQTTEQPDSVVSQQPPNLHSVRNEGPYRNTGRGNSRRQSTSRHQRFRGRGHSRNSYQTTTELIPVSTEKQYYEGSQVSRNQFYNPEEPTLKAESPWPEKINTQEESRPKIEQLGSSQTTESGIPIQLQYQQYVNGEKKQNLSLSTGMDNIENEYYTQSSFPQDYITKSFLQPTKSQVNNQHNEQKIVYNLHQPLNQDQLQLQPEQNQNNFQSQTDSSILQPDHSTERQEFQQPEVTSSFSQHLITDSYQRSQQITPTTPVTYYEEKFSATEIPQNQQRFTKYSRTRGRNPVRSSYDEQIQPTTHGIIQNVDTSVKSIPETVTEQTTLKVPYVRVRGRVRGRSRSSTRVTTTTEPPNYPDTIIKNKYKQSQITDGDTETFASQRQSGQLHSRELPPVQNPDYEGNLNSRKSSQYSTSFPDNNEELSTISTIVKKITLSSTTEEPTVKPSRRYNHILNRNKLKRRPTETSSTSSPQTEGSSNTKYLIRTTRQPPTRVITGRGRIRRPTTTTTTSSPPTNSVTSTRQPFNDNVNWVDKENLIGNTAPSASSNEIIDPYYSNKNIQETYSNYQEPIRQHTIQNENPTTKLPSVQAANPNNDDYWNQAVTIQQSTSFDFKPTQSTSEFDGSFAAGWNGQIQFQSDYFDGYQPQSQAQMSQSQSQSSANDQSPFPSNQQQVTYTNVKLQPSAIIHNQRTKNKQYENKQYENKHHVEDEVDNTSDELNDSEEQIAHASNQKINEFHGEGSKVTSRQKTGTTETQEMVLQNGKSNLNGIQSYTGNVQNTSDTSAEDNKQTEASSKRKHGRRRGNWVRVRVKKPADLFETAESQNLPSVSVNAIHPPTKPFLDNVFWMLQTSTTEPAITKKDEDMVPKSHDYTSDKFQSNEESKNIFDTTEKSNKTVSNNDAVDTIQEPKETINFEKALTDMMKKFITDSESNIDENFSERKNTTITTIATTITEFYETTDKTEDLEVTTLPSVTDFSTSLESLTDSSAENDDFEPTTTNSLITTVHEQPLDSSPPKILGTSTTTEISLETEICYRGRCVKTKSDNNSDLLTVE